MINRIVHRIQKVYEKHSTKVFLFKTSTVNERFVVNEFVNSDVIGDFLDALKNEK